MKRIKNNQGFTLLEMLLILSISSLLASFIVPSFHQWREKLEVRFFLSTLEEEIYQLQQCALLNNEDTKLIGKVEENMVLLIKSQENKVTEKMALPRTLHLVKDITIIFKATSGHVSKMPKIQLQTAKRLYIYQFQIGSSRYVCKEQSL